MSNLSSEFDFKFDQLNVRYVSNSVSYISGGQFPQKDSESCLNLGRPGAILVLGKNGSGKSRFLKSLGFYGQLSLSNNSYRSFKPSRQPEISFRYSVPTIDENYEYLEARHNWLLNDDSFSQIDDFFELQQHKNEILNLFFHDALIRTICETALKLSFLVNFNVESKELLKHFGFTELEISRFEERITQHQNEFVYSPGWDQIERPRENLNFRDYFAEFFLVLLSSSEVHRVPWEVGPGTNFDCREFLSDKNERERLMVALRELYENTTHVELKTAGKDLQLSLISASTPSIELQKVVNFLKGLSKKYENKTFPFDLLRTEEGFLALQFIPLRLDSSYRWQWRPFDVVDATFSSRKESLENLNRIFRSFVSMKVDQESLTHYQVDVSGLADLDAMLRQVNTLLREVDIGVAQVGLQKVGHSWDTVSVKFPGADHDFTPVVGWQDSITNRWLPLKYCSDGQLEVIRILVNLCSFTRRSSAATAKFLLIDEFDRHLNPIIAQQTLSLVNRYAKKFNTYALISTHSISSLDIYKHSQVFASRDVNGFFNLSMYRIGDNSILSDQLGIPERDVKRFSKLFVMVEGDHEEIIFNELFSSNNFFDYEIINLSGLKQIRGRWRSELQYENADVLVVYDNRNAMLEEMWSNLQKKWGRAQIAEKLFERSGFKQMRKEAYSRLDKGKGLPGDVETNFLGFLFEEVLDKTLNQQKNIKRLHLHGVEVADIVDCLPIEDFPTACKEAKNWKNLHERHPKLTGQQFKRRFDINNETVQKSVRSGNFRDSIHPELQKLWARIQGLFEDQPNWM